MKFHEILGPEFLLTHTHTTPGAFFAADLVSALHYCQTSFLFGWILWVEHGETMCLWKLSSIITCLWVNYKISKPPGHRTSLQMWFHKGNHPKMGVYEWWWISVAFPDTVSKYIFVNYILVWASQLIYADADKFWGHMTSLVWETY